MNTSKSCMKSIGRTLMVLVSLCLLIPYSKAWESRLGDIGSRDSCGLVTYRGSQFTGNAVRIHSGFRSSAILINSFASNCNIKLYITSSFRKSGQKVSGAIVKPAKRGNHFVGHAIDFNAIDDGKFCNSRCLQSPPAGYTGVKCFIDNIQGDSTLRWGGDFSNKDPVHIDDNLNWKNPDEYNRLYNDLQRSGCN